MHASLPAPLKARLTFTLADFADCDLAAMVREAAADAAAERRDADGEQAAAAPASTSALIFINNLAFPPGVSLRHARQLRGVGAELRAVGVEVTVVSSVPLPALEGEEEDGAPLPLLPPVTLTLAMSFNPAHDARVYAA